MKSQGAAKNEANNAAQSAPAKSVATFTATSDMAEKIDFSNVEVEPLFEDMVDFDTFSKSDFRAVKVKECEAVPKSKKLLKFVLDDGSGTDRVILSGIHDYYEPEELIGKTLIAIVNLPPRKMMGIDSCGMIISATPTGRRQRRPECADGKRPDSSRSEAVLKRSFTTKNRVTTTFARDPTKPDEEI